MLEELYLKNSNIPLRYKNDIQLDAYDSDLQTFGELNEIKQNISDFVKQGSNLLIWSTHVGNGKTTWATKMLKEYIKQVSDVSFKNDTPALFINVSNFINEKKYAMSDSSLAEKVLTIEKNILTAKLVVFDDIGDKTLSEYDLNLLYYWIDTRTANLKSCIYTTNQRPEDLKKSLSGKLCSRVVSYSIQKEIKDGDNRRS